MDVSSDLLWGIVGDCPGAHHSAGPPHPPFDVKQMRSAARAHAPGYPWPVPTPRVGGVEHAEEYLPYRQACLLAVIMYKWMSMFIPANQLGKQECKCRV